MCRLNIELLISKYQTFVYSMFRCFDKEAAAFKPLMNSFTFMSVELVSLDLLVMRLLVKVRFNYHQGVPSRKTARCLKTRSKL